MFFRIVSDSFGRKPRRKLLTAAALALGIAVTTATLTVALDVGDRLEREFRALGANLLVTPQADTLPLEIGGVDYRPVSEGAYLPAADLGKLRTIFWRNNITGFAPFLDVPVEWTDNGRNQPGSSARATLVGTWFRHDVPVSDGTIFTTGVAATNPWWRVQGRWFADNAPASDNAASTTECVVGSSLAQRASVNVGDVLTVKSGGRSQTCNVTGIVSTGSREDDSILAPLEFAGTLAGQPGRYRTMLVSALTKPEDDFSRRDPAKMTPDEYDRWFCTPYISSISQELREILPGTEIHAIRQVAEGEGRLLGRVSSLMWLVTFAALLAAGLAVAATSATTVLERRAEIGLMKAIGAANRTVSALFLAEQFLLAFVGGATGYALGIVLARVLGEQVFGIAPSSRLILFPIVLALAGVVVFLGSFVPLRSVARVEPAASLHGE
jgi:putative ABC transport system permease protein